MVRVIRRPTIYILATAVAFVAALPAHAKTSAFRTPSKNIYCLYSSSGDSGAFIRCDVLSLNDVGFLLERRGRGRRESGSREYRRRPAGSARPALWHITPLRAVRRAPRATSGLTCRSRASGHGFALSRQHQRVF